MTKERKEEKVVRRKAAGMMAVCLILAAIVWPAQVLAAQDEVVYYEDGSYAVVVMEEENTVTRATNRKTGSKAYKYYTADDELVWTVTLNATFSYNGSSATCTSVNSLNVTIYDDSWRTYSKSSTKSGNTATGYVTMRYSGLLGSRDIPATVTLSCDKNGNLS